MIWRVQKRDVLGWTTSIAEEELDTHNITLEAHNVTADTFSQTYNTQRDDANATLTSYKLDKSDHLSETLKKLTINNTGYYVSDSANANDAKGDPASGSKTVTHTSDGKERKVMDTINGSLQKKLLSNQTFPIGTTTMDPRIGDRIATCGGTPHTIATPTTKEVITNAACSSARVNRTPGYVSWAGRDGTTPGNCAIYFRPPRHKYPVLIGGIGVSPVSGHSGILQILNK